MFSVGSASCSRTHWRVNAGGSQLSSSVLGWHMYSSSHSRSVRHRPRRSSMNASRVQSVPFVALMISTIPSSTASRITNAVKADLFTRLRREVEERTVSFPADDLTIADMATLRRTVTAAGNERYEGGDDESHADRATAIALGLLAAGSKRGTARAVKIVGGEGFTS